MRFSWNPIACVACFISFSCHALPASDPFLINLQEDGSLVVFDPAGGIADFVKQGTPRQSIKLSGQNANVSYGFNSAGKKTVLISLPGTATGPAVFVYNETQIHLPPKSTLRFTLSPENRVEKMDGNPTDSVTFQAIPKVS